MYTIRFSIREVFIALLAVPIVALAGYVSWLVVPVVVREVVPAVVRAALQK